MDADLMYHTNTLGIILLFFHSFYSSSYIAKIIYFGGKWEHGHMWRKTVLHFMRCYYWGVDSSGLWWRVYLRCWEAVKKAHKDAAQGIMQGNSWYCIVGKLTINNAFII